MTPGEFLALFNIGSLLLFVVLAVLVSARMLWRLLSFILTETPVPILLKRDVLLFVALVIFFGLGLIALAFRWDGLRDNFFWVIPRTVFVLVAMAYWVWVEYHLDTTP